MAERLIGIRKESGGCTLTHDGAEYSWPKDGSVVEVPYGWGQELKAIRGGGFSDADDEAAGKAHAEAAHVASTRAPDEPPRDAPVPNIGLEARAPKGLGLPVAQEQLPPRPIGRQAPGSQAPESGDGSPITPKPRAGTRPAAKK